jgi:uncharacterized protein YndB with AHSA1/START domain
MAEADLARFIDRYTIEYVRTYPHPIERVWRAITDPTEMSVWFSPIRVDARLGGAYTAEWEQPTDFKGVITALEPPRRVRFGGPAGHGPEGYWQFELEPVEGGGTRMVFIQHSQPGWFHKPEWPLDPPESAPDTPWRPGTLGGWHVAFDSLGEMMDGLQIGDQPPRTEFKTARAAASLRLHERDEALARAYREHMRATMP